MNCNEKQARLNALKQLLISSDYKALKFSEGGIADADYAPIKAQRRAWRDEINTLEAEILVEGEAI